MIKHITWVDSVTKNQFQQTWQDDQLINFYKAKSKVSYVAIAGFLLLSCGGFFMIFWGNIYQFILKKISAI